MRVRMEPPGNLQFFSYSTFAFHSDRADTPAQHKIQEEVEEPTRFQSPPGTHFADTPRDEATAAAAATRIQSAFRARVIRALYKEISSVNWEAERLQRLIQRQETVDAIRGDGKERVRVNEALMGLLLRLDSVPGVDDAVRGARRKVSRRIVALQEVVDGVAEEKLNYGWDDDLDGFVGNWDDVVAKMEEQVCREKGGEEMERFCAEYLGFRCFQRFLQEL